MARFVEPVGGGLVTIRDAAFLSEGELSDLHNAVYRAQSMSLYRATGRTSFGTVSAADGSNVIGLRSVQFDNGNYYLVALCSDTLLSAAVGDTGTFGTITSVVSGGLTLERVHYNNRYFMFTGATSDVTVGTASNRVLYQSATAAATQLQVRQHGMAPVSAAPNVTSTTGQFSQNVTGYFEYWTTEVARITQDNAELVLESTFASTTQPTTFFVAATATVPVIQMPAIQNPGFTTHWRVYRSPKKATASEIKFPIGFMIAEVAATGASAASAVSDSLTVSTTSSLAASADTGFIYATVGFASASSMFADDGVYASGAVTLGPKQQNLFAFNFGGITANIRGIAVEVQGYVSVGTAPCPVDVSIGKRDSNTGYFTKAVPILPFYRKASKSGLISSTSSASPTTFTVGSSADIWFPPNNDLQRPLTPTDMDGSFMVVLQVSNFNTTVGIDYVKVYVYFAATIDSVIPFPSVVYTFGDVTAQVGKNHPPPPADTADMYQDSLVCNDKNSPSFVRWSWPGDPEIFPPLYYIDFETEHNDRVRLVKVVNDRCVVGLDHSIWRINYLPSERDSSFDRGKAIQRLSNRFGCVSPMCSVVFSPDGATELLAFVSHKGIHSTDGYNFQTLTDLDWRGVINPTATGGPIALIDNPEEQELIFYYQNSSLGTESVMALHLNYSPMHRDEAGNPKVSGPVHMRNYDANSATSAVVKSAWSLPRTDGRTSIYLGYGGASAAGGGKVYIESGDNIPAQDPAMSWTTRRLYLAGPGNEWRSNGVFAYFDSISSGQTIQVTPLAVFSNDEVGEFSGDAVSRSVTAAKQYYFPMNQGGEGMRLRWAVTSGTQFGLTVGQQIIDGQDFGLEDSGR